MLHRSLGATSVIVVVVVDVVVVVGAAVVLLLDDVGPRLRRFCSLWCSKKALF